MRSYILTSLFAVSGLFAGSVARAQCTPVLANDTSQLVVNGEVLCTATRGNTLYAGGRFSLIGRRAGHFVAIDTATGKPQINNWPKVNGNVYKVIADGAGGWIIGGTFSKVGDSVRNNIAQITAAGAVTAWNPNANGGVYALLIANNSLYMGGGFTNVHGVARNRAARVDMTAGAVATWNPNASDTVTELQVYNNRIYAGGKFATIGGLPRRCVAKLDSVTGAAYAWNVACSGPIVNSIAFRNSSVYIGGGFYNMGGLPRYGVVSVDSGSAAVSSWDVQVSGTVNKIVLNSTTMYVGGSFTSVHGVPRAYFAEVSLLADTATSSFPYVSPFPVNDILVNGSKIYLARSIAVPVSYISELYFRDILQLDIPTGTATGWKSLTDDNVNTLAISGNLLYAGGNFHTAGATYRPMVGAIDMDADTVTAWNPRADYPVTTIAIGPSSVYLGGGFTYLGDYPHSKLGAVDFVVGDSVAGFHGSVGFFASGYLHVSKLIYNSGQLYVAGSFDRINGIAKKSVAIIDGTTGAVSAWDAHCLASGYAPDISQIAMDGTNMFILGDITDIGGTPRANYGAVSLATGAVAPWYPSITGGALQYMTISNGAMYLGGTFDHVDGVFLPRLAKYNLASGIVSPWQPYPSGAVNFIKQQQNFVYAGGSFGAIHGVAVSGLGIVDTSSNTPVAWNPSVNGYINDLAFYSNKMYAVGAMTSMSGDDNVWNIAEYKINTLSNIVAIGGPSTMCLGSSATYTVSTTAPGSTFDWRVNGVSAGTSGSSFTYIPANGDRITCVGYSVPGSCYTPDSALSNTIVVTVNPFVTVSGPSVACAGSSITDTAHTASGGIITYQWKVNGISAGTGSTHTYVPASGDVITVTIHGATGCPSDSATSPAITMTVNPAVDILTGVTTMNDTLCAGVSASFTAHSLLSGLHYQWKVNTTSAGTDDSTFAYTPVDGDVVKCIATAPAGGCYIADPDSGSVHMVVRPNTHPAIVTTGDTVLCAGVTGSYSTTPTFTGATYAWYTNGVAAGVTTPGYSYVPAAGDVVKCIVTLPSTGCFSTSTDTSSKLYVVVHPAVAPTATITGPDAVCAGASATYYTAAPGMTPAGYQWLVNGIVAGGSTSTYTYAPADGNNVKCIVTVPTGSCFTSPTATSNTIAITVTPLTVPSISLTAPTLAVPGEVVNVNATVSDAGSSYLITWYNNSSFLNTSTTPVTTYVKGSGTDNITAKVRSLSAGCYDSTTSAAVTVNEGVAGIAGLQPGGNAINAYPNPFGEEVHVSGLAEGDVVTVVNAAGVRINDVGISGSGAERVLTLRALPPGLYLIRVADSKGNDKAKLSIVKG